MGGKGGAADGALVKVSIHSDKTKNVKFPSNFIKTAKYTWWNFLVLNLMQQFSRASNVYFFANMCVALVPGVSPINPITAVLPLLFVLTVAGAKAWWEDLQRTRDDRKWNSQPGKYDENDDGTQGRALSGIVKDGVLHGDIPSKDIEVGDIIKLARGEQVRADVLLLSTNDAEHVAYIETMQLDGETNAKLRQAAHATNKTTGLSENITKDLVTEEAFRNADIYVECVRPSANLHDWTGLVEYRGQQEGVNTAQFLYRGSVLVNTSWAYGIVLYTGMDTKMQKNNKPKKQKFPNLDRKLGNMIKALFVVQQMIIFLMCGLAVVYQQQNHDKAWYLQNYLTDMSDVGLFFWRYLTYFILVSVMIPISLFVTIELTKAVQAKFMEWDPKMKTRLLDANGDTIGDGEVGCNPRTSDLNEQLAIVRFIFSDKTGTLTENRMEFHTGEIGQPENRDIRSSGVEFHYSVNNGDLLRLLHSHDVKEPPMAHHSRSSSNIENVLWYLMNLAMCHELSVFVDEHNKSDKTLYQGASPDEVALAKAAQNNGVEFVSRNSSSITIRVMGKDFVYRIVDTLPFTSKRKMMSIVLQGPCEQRGIDLRDTKQTTRFCLTKGADSAVMQLCAGAVSNERDVHGRERHDRVEGLRDDPWYTNYYQNRLNGELTKLGGIGLRTLVMAYKPLLDDKEFGKWQDSYSSAKKIVGSEERDAAMESCWAQMERNFFACGATAIEDKLQDQVPETIDHLISAGIVVWMLTGDKQETAETIAGTARLVDKQTWQLCYISASLPGAYSEDVSLPEQARARRRLLRESWLCGLSDPSATTPPIFASDSDDALEAFKAGRSVASGSFLARGIDDAKRSQSQGQKSAIVTDGATLSIIIPPGPDGCEEPAAKDAVEKMWSDFIELARIVNSGVLCRLTPEQKGRIVRAFQEKTGETALAIGDGSNDVPMINESYVGIGIMGLEGSQAVLASDYAIPRFKHLKRLMMVHGRYALYRNAMCIMFSFYKNFTLSLIQIIFSFLCGFSGQTLFDSWLLAFQNFAFTSIPPLFVGMFEKDVAEDMVEEKPVLYTEMSEGLYFDTRAIIMWFGGAVWHSILLFGLTYTTQENDDFGGENGRTIDLLSHGALILTCQICTVLAKLAVHIRCWTWIQLLGILLSIFFYLLFLVVYSSIPILFGDSSFYYSGFYILNDPKYWLWVLFFVVGVVGTVDLPILYLQKQYRPTKRDLAQRLSARHKSLAEHQIKRSQRHSGTL